MKCPECTIQQLKGRTKPIKEGYLLKHKKRVFGKDWKENWVVLYEDSTMAYYKKKDKQETPLATIFVKEAPEMLAVGQFTFRIPSGTPPLPPGSNYNQLMAFGSKTTKEVHWLLASSENELNEWMSAISNTLPPRPSQAGPQLKSESKNNEIMFCNTNETTTGNTSGSSMKPLVPDKCKCKHNCTACGYLTNCTQQKALSKKWAGECGTGFLTGYHNANVACGWRGWGEGSGWQNPYVTMCGQNCNLAICALNADPSIGRSFVESSVCIPDHHVGLADGGINYHISNYLMTPATSVPNYEATTVMDTTNETTGFLSIFDFLF